MNTILLVVLVVLVLGLLTKAMIDSRDIDLDLDDRHPDQFTHSTVTPVADPNLALAMELVRDTVAALERTVIRVAGQVESPADHAQPAADQPQQQPFTAADIPWDPTDGAPGLTTEYAAFAPQWGNDAPPPITHPLGIPGLANPFAVDGSSR